MKGGFYVIEVEYVGPNQNNLQTDRDHIVNGHYFSIQDHPGVTNMSREPKIEGWLGTTNDWHEYAHGRFDSLEEAESWVQKRISEISRMGYRREEPYRGAEVVGLRGDEPIIEHVRYYVGDELWANVVDAGEWLAETSNDELGIRSDTSGDDLARIRKTLEVEAEGNGFRYWRLQEELERRRDEETKEEA